MAKALADPKRLCVLQSLADGELSVSDLSERVGCHVPNMSQHLAVLRNSGLVAALGLPYATIARAVRRCAAVLRPDPEPGSGPGPGQGPGETQVLLQQANG